MLHEQVLEELTRKTQLQEHLVKMAWPDISTESKLAIIQSTQNSAMKSTPSWLLRIAMEDKATVVRLWAAKHGYFEKPYKDGQLRFGEPPSEEDIALREKGLNDVEPLVRACVDMPSSLMGYDELTNMPQLDRLLSIRNNNFDRFDEAFINWIAKAFDAGISDSELRDCVDEYFMTPGVSTSLTEEESGDIFMDMGMKNGMEKGWELAKRVTPVLQLTLASRLPLRVGRFSKITAEEMAEWPSKIQDCLIYRTPNESTDELWKFRRMIEEHPEKFVEEVVKSLEQFRELNWDEETIRRDRVASRPDSNKAILDEIHLLMNKVAPDEDSVTGKPSAMDEKISNIYGKVGTIHVIAIAVVVWVLFKQFSG